jgi:hypothetical protein
MKLILERTPHSALVNELPTSVWRAWDLDTGDTATALVAEIILQARAANVEQMRQEIYAELSKDTGALLIHPTPKIVIAGTTRARIWLGTTGNFLPVVVLICSIHTHSIAMEHRLRDALQELPADRELTSQAAIDLALSANPEQVLR